MNENSGLNLKNENWIIVDGTLYEYRGNNIKNVVVPEGVHHIYYADFNKNPFGKKEIKNIIIPKSLKSIKMSIDARTITIYDTTDIIKTYNTNFTIETIKINNTGSGNIYNNIDELIHQLNLLKLKKIIIFGKTLSKEENKKITNLLKFTDIKLYEINEYEKEEFVIKDGLLLEYNGQDKNIIIPEGVKIIDENALNDCGIKSVILPESLEMIKDNAFSNNNLENIIIPSNVSFISSNAFFNNPNLKTIEMSVNNQALLTFGMSNLEHLILNCSDVAFSESFISIKNLLKSNINELSNLKSLTIKNDRISYFDLKYVLEEVSLKNIELHIEEASKANSYTFIDGKLNSVTINESSYDITYLESLNECYKLYINNKSGKGVEEFINFITNNYFKKPKNLGMIIIIGQNISLREKLALNKALGKIIIYDFKPNEELENNTNEEVKLDNTIEDEEINKILNDITSILNTQINNEDKIKIQLLISNIINKYKENLIKLQPKLFDKKSSFGEEIITPETLRINLILELNNILIKLKNNDIYLNLRKKIKEYEYLTKQENIQMPTEIKLITDKIKYITIKSKTYEKYNFLKELQTILSEVKKQISKSIVSLTTQIELVNELPIEKILDEKIDDLYEKTKRISKIEDTFNNENSELAKDINTIKKIISNFSIEHQKIYSNKIYNIINKYYIELINGQRQNLTEAILEIRKEWQPLLEELSLKSHFYSQYKELLDELNNEKNDRVSVIEILINEINTLKDNNILDDLIKTKISGKLENIINFWKSKLINNEEIKSEEDIFESLCKNYGITYIPRIKNENICIEIEIQIAKDLLNLKEEILTFIQEKEEYEKLTKMMRSIKISG